MIEKIYLLIFLVTFLQINAMNIYVSDQKAKNELVHRKNAKTTPPKNILMLKNATNTLVHRKNSFTTITRTTKQEGEHNREVYDTGYGCGWCCGCCLGGTLATLITGAALHTLNELLIWQSENT